MSGRLGFILKGYPRLSETFIAQEIANLEARGFLIDIFSLRHPTDKTSHPVHGQIKAPVTYLPEYLHDEPTRVLRAWQKVRGLPGYAAARACFSRDVGRDITRNRARRFGQAMVLAAEAPPEITHFHAHFVHTPSSVARYAALISGREWSFSAHAKDIFTSEDWELEEKLPDAAFGVTCTQAGADYLNNLGQTKSGPVNLIYHGIDLARFDPPAKANKLHQLRIVSVGRCVPKKGYPDLLEALAKLPSSANWSFEHIGGGALLETLKEQAVELGIDHRITWRGSQPQTEVVNLLGRGDVFVLASTNQPDGDRDGIPNVLLESMAAGLVVAATDAGAISELITHEQTGLLVPSGDTTALTQAIRRLSEDTELRTYLRNAAQRMVRAGFDTRLWADRLAALLSASVPRAAPDARDEPYNTETET